MARDAFTVKIRIYDPALTSRIIRYKMEHNRVLEAEATTETIVESIAQQAFNAMAEEQLNYMEMGLRMMDARFGKNRER